MKDTYIRIRVSSEQKDLWKRGAYREGKTITEFVIDAVEAVIANDDDMIDYGITDPDIIEKYNRMTDDGKEFKNYLNKEEVK